MDLFFLSLLVLPWLLLLSSPLSVWTRRASVALVLPTLAAALAWCLVILPMSIQPIMPCVPPQTRSLLLLGALLLATAAATATLATTMRLRVDPRWTVLLPSALILGLTQVVSVKLTVWTLLGLG